LVTPLTSTVIVSAAVQPPSADVPMTVYVVVAVGEAMTVAPVVVFRPAAGLQTYVAVGSGAGTESVTEPLGQTS
jgi:hypothetical protein